MNWIKQNIIPLALTALFGVLTLFGVWLLRSSLAERQRWQEEYNTKASNLARLTTKPGNQSDWVFPSNENARILIENADLLKEIEKRLVTQIAKNQIKYDAIEGFPFHQHASSRIKRLRDKTAQARINVPPVFGFGFYYYAQGARANKENTPLLLQQLDVVESMVNTLIETRVISIDEVRVIEPQGERFRKDAAGLTVLPPDEVLPREHGIVVKKEGPYEYRLIPFEFAFHSDTDTLRKILNQIAQQEQFKIVGLLNIETVPPPAGTAVAASDTDDGGDGEPRRYIFGEEKIKVRLLLYLVTFPVGASK